MFKGGFLEALAVGEARAEVTPEAATIVKSIDGACAGDDASSKSSVGFGASAGAEGKARQELPARVEKAGLIVAAGVEPGDEARIGILDFIFVAGGDSTGAERESGLLLQTGTVELVNGGKGRRIRICIKRAVFMPAKAMDPMRASAEIPAQVDEKKLEAFELREAGREKEDGPWKTGEAGVAADGEAQMIGVAEAVAEVAGETAIEEGVIGSLTAGLEIGTGERVIERAENTSDQSATARGRVAAAFGEEIELGNAGGAAMAEKLNDTGDGIGAVERTLCAVDDFELVNVVEGLTGEIEEAAGLVEGRAVDEEFGEIGIAAVEEESCETAFAAGACDSGAGKSEECVGKRYKLTLADFVRRQDVDSGRA